MMTNCCDNCGTVADNVYFSLGSQSLQGDRPELVLIHRLSFEELFEKYNIDPSDYRKKRNKGECVALTIHIYHSTGGSGSCWCDLECFHNWLCKQKKKKEENWIRCNFPSYVVKRMFAGD